MPRNYTKQDRGRGRKKVQKNPCLPQAYSSSMHTGFYLSVYNNNSKIPWSMADPIITLLQPFIWIYSQHDLMSEALPCVSKQFY